jgi:D-alanyl-D-alanine carboxypeptidase (penicillin-binding protein 5/6)
VGKYKIDYGYSKGISWRRRIVIFAVVVVIASLSYTGFHRSGINASNAVKPLVSPEPQGKIITPILWPGYGQSAYGELNSGVLAVSDDAAKSAPTASLAKVITALAILKQKPLAPGQQGPMITLTQEDVDSFSDYVRKNGAVVAVEAGEQISQYQAMQAMLMPSANNMADTLARWAFGSLDAYSVYANAMVNEMGLTQTHVADASGFSPKTTSTAHDLVQLGIFYMKEPLLTGIASQTEAKIPVAGIIRNYNSLVNEDGILGIKVGDTDEAGRCFLVADVRSGSNDKATTAVAAVMGADNLKTAMEDAKAVLHSGNKGYDLMAKR